ncbi:MAG TPA: type II toxin-antitoxin system VapB family antitoxin [Nitrospiraceae bacterium]|nr:type II toxin-antitoxin system VapB family antitoxin [Nitrospiraceae bacterium]
MRVTIDIDQSLLRTAQKALGTDSIKGTVERSLRTVIQHHRLQFFADALGAIPLDLTTDQVRQQRRKRIPHVSH